MELLSQRAYARRRGVSQAAVWKAIRDGRISVVKVRKGVKINPRTADREWAENTDRSKPRNSEIGDPARRRPAGEPAAPMDLDGVGGYEQLTLLARSREEEPEPAGGNGGAAAGEGGNGGAAGGELGRYAEHRARREAALARKAELELELQIGGLVRAEDVRRRGFDAARKARDLLVAIPERVAAVLAAADDPDEVLEILEGEIERVCGELSGGDAKRE